jgi:phosphatidylserine decarboxylase
MVQEVGRLQQGTLLTAKGVKYTLSSLLPSVDPQPFENGAYAVLFLSPADCHRVFSPVQGGLEEIVHVPGRRLLVHPPFQRAEFPVFVLNERVIMRFQTPQRKYLLVLVAGWGVGNITHPWRRTRPKLSRRRITRRRFESPRSVAGGEWVATFELGSTVILIAEADDGVVTHVEADEQVHYGEPMFTFDANIETT